MKFGTRFSLIASVAMAAGLVPAMSAQAQGSTCTLAAADCQLISDASANVAKENSFVQTFTFKVDIQGSSPATLTVTGSGPFAVDASANIKDQKAVINAIQMQLDLAASGSTSAQSGKISIVIKGGNLYIQDPTTSKWTGIDLNVGITQAQAAIQQMQSSSASSSSSSAASSAQAQQMMTQLMSDPAVLTSLRKLPDIKGFITQARIADATLENQAMAQFQYTVNPGVLFTSPDVLPLVKALLKAAAAASPSSASQFSQMGDQQLQGMLMMGGGVLGTTNVQVTRWVGQNDKLFHALDVLINLNIDPTTMGGTGSPTNGTIDFNIQLTKVGQPVSVTAPAGATMLDLSQMSGLGGMGGSSSSSATTPAVTATP